MLSVSHVIQGRALVSTPVCRSPVSAVPQLAHWDNARFLSERPGSLSCWALALLLVRVFRMRPSSDRRAEQTRNLESIDTIRRLEAEGLMHLEPRGDTPGAL